MKKYIFFVMAAAAMVGCSKSEVPSTDGGKNEIDQKYVIYVEDVTKTVTDDSFSVTWTDDDNLAVYTWLENVDLPDKEAEWQAANPVNFVAASGTPSLRSFSLSGSDDANSLAKEEYSTRLSAFKDRYGDGTSSLKWGVIYPGQQSMASYSGMGVVVFGDYTLVRSRQDGNDNMSHLSYQDVLWGTAYGTAPTIQMKHLGTLMVYTVKNETLPDFIVKSIKIAAPGANIGGEFRINVFDGTFDSCMTALNECTLWVENGTAIPKGGSAKFYQVLAPFTLESGNTIAMTVETDKGTWTKQMTLDADKSFESGKKNTATLKIDIDPTLIIHETGTVSFGNDSKLSKYLNLSNAEMMSWSSDFNRSGEVDAIVARNGAYTTFAIAAPDYQYATAFDTSIENWAIKKSTRFKKIASDFDGTEKMSELKSAYEASGDEADRIDLSVGDIVIAKTVEGNYALIKFTAGNTDESGAWIDWSFSLKTVE
ncbi:MAG: hypothetical protein ACI39U_06395 [Candidatus Cryptobacteroides sp.]